MTSAYPGVYIHRDPLKRCHGRRLQPIDLVTDQLLSVSSLNSSVPTDPDVRSTPANVASSNIDADLRSHSRWLKLIADPVRLEIIHALAQTDEATAAQLATTGASSKPTLRRHLNALVSLGLVHCHRCESDGLTTGRPPIRFSLSTDIRASVLTVLDIGT